MVIAETVSTISLLLLAQLADPALPDSAATIAGAAAMIPRARAGIAGPRCVQDVITTDITVCGLRRADRYRVPFVNHDPGDPRHEAVAAERTRLLHRTTPIDDLTPFLVGGGMVGVSMTVGSDGSARTTGLRKLAP